MAHDEAGHDALHVVAAASERGTAAVLIAIEDEGFGISEEELKHLGEPFYSNKATGHGLGLMVSQQILSGHKGSIRYKSTLGQGTRVEIRLPI